MQEQDFMLRIQPHQLPGRCHRLIYHLLEKRGTMPDLENGQPRTIEIE